MKIKIHGIGRLGSQVAALSLIFLKPEKLILKDVKNLDGDILDLKHMAVGLGVKTEIVTSGDADVDIICAGLPRTREVSMNMIYENNLLLIDGIIRNNNIKTCLIATNPTVKFTQRFRKHHPKTRFISSEDLLSSWRGNLEEDTGMRIIKSKGYTNFAPALAIIKSLCLNGRGNNPNKIK